ncbi:ORF-97 [Buzura suppressaria nucleopolyhedrovirus]|uniref:ORF-97 n=1 Tax=Buzura suppressaria nuclear polyhedrosis virus TaxID=74320 RepID=W5VKM6_NPVBS|nr:ORF-97 [Buzura suppressaria nucleopolyhedrovirus]AHH82686.1 ORF-97 [Buzura suppressaria nucleopolyhedrovirus]
MHSKLHDNFIYLISIINTMNLTAFVLHVSNDLDLSQQLIYEKYLCRFDVIDAIMCPGTGECLAVCVGTFNAITKLPVPYEQFLISDHNDKMCELNVIKLDLYENVIKLLDNIYNVVERYNNFIRNFEL